MENRLNDAIQRNSGSKLRKAN